MFDFDADKPAAPPALARSAPHAGGDAELVAACEAFLDADRALIAWDRGGGGGDGPDLTPYYAALERLIALPARTLAALRAKARAAHAAMASVADEFEGRREEMAGFSLLADLLASDVGRA